MTLLEAILDSWDRNNTVLVNLLHALPEGVLDLRPAPGSPSIGELFTHINYCRLVFVEEDAPEFASAVPKGEYYTVYDRARLAEMLNESARVVRGAVAGRLESGRPMDRHYDHPILLLQHMVWHEGYHHGQIKLTLKQAGQLLPDQVAGTLTWDVWMRKQP